MKYEVNIPFAGYLTGTIEANSADDAINKAMADWSFRVVIENDVECEVAEVDVLSEISTGNVNHAPLNSASADQIY